MEGSANPLPVLNELTPRDRAIFLRTCGDLLVLHGAEKLREHLLKDKLSTQDLLGIVTFLRDSAYGKPTSNHVIAPMTVEFTPIQISQSAAEKAQQNDRDAGII